ncbi:hypothetical protein DCAR_0933777 [Daucus carota subsp. sativus]|uniref:DYW domain-containing protein n=1 Tax=Daucus carota subsp. sativus TaxID=79200 RepID=A0AAF0XUJ7_DAUCS|nr:hypothetical protein DCAR_0933777 [Daucus carota subsp. sativus]
MSNVQSIQSNTLSKIQFTTAYIKDTYAACCLFYRMMLLNNEGADNCTYPILGRQVHNHVLKVGFEVDVYVKNTLISMDARKVFDGSGVRDSVSWNSMLAEYVMMGDLHEAKALRLFDEGAKDLVSWTALTIQGLLVSILSACAHLSVVKTGKMIHGLSLRIGIDSYVNLQYDLMHMYSTCGNILAAEEIFKVSYQLDQISWNSMISGYLKCGKSDKARELFDSMSEKDTVTWSLMISCHAQLVRLDEATFVSVISACTHLPTLSLGKWLHACIRKNGFKINAILENAQEFFHGMEEKGVSSWNVLILGFAMIDNICGCSSACRHMGLVEEGRSHFESMIHKQGIAPNIKHYGCMVDLLGRAGLLKEAEELIVSMPMFPEVATWGALLGACERHDDNEMGERIGRKLIELQPYHDGFHVLLSNIYVSKGNWHDVGEIRGMMMRNSMLKTPGCRSIEATGVVYEFLAGDRTHPRIHEIEEMLTEMSKRLRVMGYLPDTNEVSYDVDEEDKETALFRHSEKIAIAFGLVAISPSESIRIIKNFCICTDCHEAAKLVSMAFNREIIIRD